ncbi:hypothetical protein KY336_01150 [Candidatus Woesearchaeota archaeon]|nr:hypothetical protein [Candidatus Woesearchaeota archaeon]
MKQEEIGLWRMIDVGGYKNSIGIFRSYLDLIVQDIQTGELDMIAEDWAPVRKRYEGMKKRYEAMDLSRLDDRFPKDIVTEVRDELLPRLGVSFLELEALLGLGKQHGYFPALREAVDAKIKECKENANEMLKRSAPFQDWPGYVKYRELSPDTDRQYCFERSIPGEQAV